MSTRGPHPPPIAQSAFAGFRSPPKVIVVAVRWYLRFGLSYRDVEELLVEQGVKVNHVTVRRGGRRCGGVVNFAAMAYRASLIRNLVHLQPVVEHAQLADLGMARQARLTTQPSAWAVRARRRAEGNGARSGRRPSQAMAIDPRLLLLVSERASSSQRRRLGTAVVGAVLDEFIAVLSLPWGSIASSRGWRCSSAWSRPSSRRSGRHAPTCCG
jgi:hypothetical protein